jgi:hypothetical protein
VRRLKSWKRVGYRIDTVYLKLGWRDGRAPLSRYPKENVNEHSLNTC